MTQLVLTHPHGCACQRLGRYQDTFSAGLAHNHSCCMLGISTEEEGNRYNQTKVKMSKQKSVGLQWIGVVQHEFL
jgi:viroplasmin and RNaseH domain-containing protein